MSSLDARQATIAHADADVRQLVQAGPGCGKTHVACARVAHLLDGGIEPDNILLLSFTRTAVHELRARIARMAMGAASRARGVEIRTLDSLAWRIAAGAAETATPGGHEQTVMAALAALEGATAGDRTGLHEYLARFAHVLVDESQDLVGTRARLVLLLLESLPATCGWTVFFDPAQAIYGWSGEAQDHHDDTRFIDHLPRLESNASRQGLDCLYRTGDAGMKALLETTRDIVLGGESGQQLRRMRSELASREGATAPLRLEDIAAELGEQTELADRTLLLFRRRVDALTALSYLRKANIGCRLRTGGTPRVAAPWIAVIANALAARVETLSSVTASAFESAWNIVCTGSWTARGWAMESAWEMLRRCAGGSSGRSLDLRKIAARLSVSTVPDDVFTKELGTTGPVIGTVHGSKGREADHVVFCLSPDEDREQSPAASDEEARVMYVAISRARESLRVRTTRTYGCFYHEGRAFRRVGDAVQVEVGQEGDVDAMWAMLMESPIAAAALQARLAAFDGTLKAVHVDTVPGGHWTRRLVVDDRPPDGSGQTQPVGALSATAVESLGGMVKKAAGKQYSSPMTLRHLTWIDVTTVAVSERDPRRQELPSPWRETGLLLAPVVAGMGYFKPYSKPYRRRHGSS